MTVAKAKAALKKRGIRVNIGGCGCCDSPWIKIEVDGKVILDDEGKCIYMIEDEDKTK